uniref:Rhomboid 5 (RHBDF2), mRNA protein n=1 Tax=Daphnia magna TaxID=35525 RepID=A0A0P5Q7N8_9CRUS
MSQQQHPQELLEDEQTTRNWQPLAVQQAGSCGSLTAIGLHQNTPNRHQQQPLKSSQRLLGQQDLCRISPAAGGVGNSNAPGGTECWTPLNDTASNSSSSSGWRHLASSPPRRSQQHHQEAVTNSMSSRRLSPHCWSSENLLNQDLHPANRWTSSSDPLSSHYIHHPSSAGSTGVESDREPFIPPPPLLDFETANLLPPLGIDVSSPSDDHHFMSVPLSDSNADAIVQQHVEGKARGNGGDAGVNWVQIPPQYATLRGRPSRNGNGSAADGYSLTAVRKPRGNNNLHHPPSSTSSGWMDVDHDSSVSSNSGGACHRTSIGSDGISRKCTCGQKMRLQQGHNNSSLYPEMSSAMGGGHIRSEDGLAGIATLRRPVKRKVRNPLPGSGQLPPAGVSNANNGNSATPSATSLLQQPKMETSVLLDKLLRAGALRPEDYLVLSRMERMIMANHAAGGNSLNQSGARVRHPKSSSTDRQQNPLQQQQQQQIVSPAESGTDMRREFDFGSKQLNSIGLPVSNQPQVASNENLYDSASGPSSMAQQQYQRRLSAGNNGLDVTAGQLRMQQQLPSNRPSPSPSSPFDYYNSSLASYSSNPVTGRGSSLGSANGDHSLAQPQQQLPSRNSSGNADGLYSMAQSGPYQPLASLPTAGRCCPCCGSPSHPQLQHHHHHHHHIHHTCSLCGGGPHLASGPASVPVSSSNSYSGYAGNSGKMMIQQQQPAAASSGYGFATSTARHFSASTGIEQQFAGNNGGAVASKYPAIGSSASNNSGAAGLQAQSQPAMVLGKGLAQQIGVRTELHSLPSNEPMRFTMATQNGAQHQPKISAGQAFHRSVSTPAPSTATARSSIPQQQQVQMNPIVESQQQAHRTDPLAVTGNTNHRVGLSRSLSRTEAVKEYFKQSAATFFGLDESKESELRQRWEDRRRRLAERRCGTLRESCSHDEGLESRDLVDGHGRNAAIPMERVADSPDGSLPDGSQSTLLLHPRLKRRESVARMTWDGLAYLATAIVRLRPNGPEEEDIRSRSVSREAFAAASANASATSRNGEASRSANGALSNAQPLPPDVTMDTGGTANLGCVDVTLDDEVFFDSPPPAYEDVVDAAHIGPPPPTGPTHRRESEARPSRWRRAIHASMNGPSGPSVVDRLMDNSNRRQYGMGIVGRMTRRSLRQSMTESNKHLKRQLDSFEDHRPYFTYWTCTVQVLIMFIALITYGLGPIGFNLHRRSGSVLVTSLSLQEVDYYEPSNFYIGPRAADLIHLGAKYSPCMKPDTRIGADIEATRIRERQTACCIRNDNSGCVQTSRAECSDLTSTWKKWNVVQSGPGGRISGSVCGQDPNFCIEPASVAPFEWPDDITKWPKCRKKLPGLGGSGSESKSNANHVLKTTGQADHMVCEVIGHPCCIGIHGECRIATREYCDFVKGYFHQEASLCSQVSCMNDVCGMLPFHTPDFADQFYRLWTSLFLHAGILHLAVSVTFQMIIMRDLEKLAGPLRIGIIYMGSGVVGNLASALFVPYRAEVGPSGSHFGLLACLCVEVLHAWPLLRTPWRALGRLLMTVAFLFVAGLLPWVDNFAHIFGFISGGLLSYTFLPFITVGVYDRRRKFVLICVTLALAAILLTTLVLLLYVWPIQDSGVIQTLGYLNCVPITRDFCAEQNIHFSKREINIL